MLERIKGAFRHPPGHVDERTEAVRGEALFFGWVLHMVGLSALFLHRLLVLRAGAHGWWDLALAVQTGFWLTAVLFAVRSRWAPHASGPMGASLLGMCSTAVFARLRLGADPVRCTAAGFLSAPLWYVGGLWVIHGLKRLAPGDERTETVRLRATVVGETVLSVGMLALFFVRAVLGRFEGNVDVGLLWLLPAALGGFLYQAWGGHSAEAHAAAVRRLPRGLAFCALGWLVAFYLIHRDWARAAWMTLYASVSSLIWLWTSRPRNQKADWSDRR